MFSPKVLAILLALLLAGVGVIGDDFVKLAGDNPRVINWIWLTVGLLIYAATAFGWLFVMRHLKLATIGVYYSIGTVLLLVFMGAFLFHEEVSAMEMLGILMAIASLVLLGKYA